MTNKFAAYLGSTLLPKGDPVLPIVFEPLAKSPGARSPHGPYVDTGPLTRIYADADGGRFADHRERRSGHTALPRSTRALTWVTEAGGDEPFITRR